MRVSSIDIGTNAVLLLIADIDDDGIIHALAHEQRLPRLGKDVDGSRAIDTAAFEQVSTVLSEYMEISAQFGRPTVIACATSAVREASNKHDFLYFVKRKTGLDIEVISGDDEALWTYKGALSGFSTLSRDTAVIDIGGGSTEISYPRPHSGNGHAELKRYSLELGAVRLTERYFKHNPPLGVEIESATAIIREELSQVHNPGFYRYGLVGVAGTVTTLACLDQHLVEFDAGKVSGYPLSQSRVEDWSLRMRSMHSDQVRALSNATVGRADILTAGVLILSETMKLLGFRSVLVSERGLRYGLVIREWERTGDKPTR